MSVNGQKIAAVAAGGFHSTAITDSHEVWTWGYNGHGQLGVGGAANRHGPVKVSVNQSSGSAARVRAASQFHSVVGFVISCCSWPLRRQLLIVAQLRE